MKLDLGLEAISPMINDKVVDDLVDKFSEIRELMNYKRIFNGLMAFQDKDIGKLYKDIDKILYKRFGIKYKHIYSQTHYAVIPISIDKNNPMQPDLINILKEIQNELPNCRSTFGCDDKRDPDEVVTMLDKSDLYSMMNHILDNIRDNRDQLAKGKIIVDRKKAYIYGLANKKPIYLITDPYQLFKVDKLTDREIAAILLHEIGHSFTAIENINRVYVETTVLLNASSNDINATKEKFKLTIKKEMDVEEVTNVTYVKYYIEFVKRIRSSNVDFSRDFEQQADNFANRFGLGRELVSSLHKISNIYDPDPHMNRILSIIYDFIIISLMFFMLGLLVALPIVYILASILVYYIIEITITFITGSSKSNYTTYDYIKERYNKIRKDLIRQIRQYNLPKEVELRYLEDIKYIEGIISLYPEESLLARIGDYLPWNYSKKSDTELKHLIEEIQENILHATKIELKKYL